MTIAYGSITTETLAGQIAKLIRSSILEGKLAVDERLPTEEELALRFGVSRPTIREALKRLAAQNLVRSRRGPLGGTFVNCPSIEEAKEGLAALTTMLVSVGAFGMAEIMEARHQLELICVRLAAEHRTQHHIDTMQREIEIQRSDKLTDVEFCATDVRFHRAIVDAAGNPLFGFLMTALVEALQPVSNLVVFRFRERQEIVRHHQNIYAALERGDADAAGAALVEQVTYLRERFARAQEWREAKDREARSLGT